MNVFYHPSAEQTLLVLVMLVHHACTSLVMVGLFTRILNDFLCMEMEVVLVSSNRVNLGSIDIELN
jgi:uncharacterized membrane protein YphA (DoxX/SURF4 family)